MKIKPSWTKARKEWGMVIVGERKCPQCKEMFGIRQGNRRQKNCSHECYHKSQRVKKPKRPCAVCGKSFTTNRKIQKTCSIKCGAIYREGKRKKKYTPKQKVYTNIRRDYCHQDWLECVKYSECGGNKKGNCFVPETQTCGTQGISSECKINL